jgi:hypothetical protein
VRPPPPRLCSRTLMAAERWQQQQQQQPPPPPPSWMTASVSARLRAHGRHRWHIEFGGFLSNHLWHGVVALAAVGADIGYIDAFIADYTDKLEPAQTVAHSALPLDKQIVELGRRQHFDEMVEVFSRSASHTGESSCGLVTPRLLVLPSLRRLLDGLGGAAFHAVIHLGIGMRLCGGGGGLIAAAGVTSATECTLPQQLLAMARNNVVAGAMVAEGLAYLAHSWLPIGGDSELFDSSIFGFGGEGVQSLPSHSHPGKPRYGSWEEAVIAVRNDRLLTRLLRDEWTAIQPLPVGYFQKCMHIFSGPSDRRPHISISTAAAKGLLSYARVVPMPACALQAGARLLSCALMIFVRAPLCDYFLLHGVTAAFALVTLLPCLDGSTGALLCCQC